MSDFTLTKARGCFYDSLPTFQIAGIFQRKSWERGCCLAVEGLHFDGK